MNQKLRNGLLVAGILLLPAISYSQQLGGTAPDPKMLPGGTSLGSAMGSVYAPNLYDGTVNVTIPIYQYSNDAGNFGISLTYNTKGVPVDEMSSAVGLHWNIAAEGSGIRRTVKGLPDEFNVPNVPDSIYEDVDTRYYAFKGRLAASFENASQAADPEVFRDGESDDFEVSAGGLSFTFNIGRDRSIFVNPDKNIKVEILSNGVPYANVASSNPNFYDPLSLEFRVTDLQGNQYYFKKGTYDNNVMYAETDASALPNSIATYNLLSRWVLSEVTLANGSKIKYNYKYGGRDEYTYQSYSATDVFWIPMGSSVEKKSNFTCELSSIEYPNGVTARFVYDTLKKRLDYMENPAYPAPETGHLEGALREVRIESGSNCLRYKMDQSYTVAKGYDNQTVSEVPYDGPFTVITDTWSSPQMRIVGQRSHRLRLNGISLLSCDGTKEEPYYSFTYYATGLPCRFNSAQDYFGYYNGKQNTTEYPNQDYPDVNLTIPNHKSAVAGNNFSYGADRSEDATKIKASILTEVKNAYGGKVAFEYEGHTLMDIPLQGLPSDSFFYGKTTADGLRIRTITETDPYYPANAKITSFTYTGGQLFLAGGYYHAPKVLTSISPSSPEFGIGIWTGTCLTPHQMVNGSSHGYSQVTVVTKDNNNNLLSKKDILFTNFKDATSNNLPRYTRTAGSKHYYEFPFTDKQYLRDWEMGLPLQITDYDENGRITSKTFNNYTFSIDTTTSITKKVDGAKASYVKDPYKTPFPSTYLWTPKTAILDPYKPFAGKALLARTVIQKYISDAAYISDTVQYVYDSRSNLSSIVAYNSKGEATVTKHVYNYDVPPNVGGTILSGLEKIVSTQRWKRRPAQQDSVLLDAFFNRYTNQFNGSSPVNIWSKAMYSLVAGSPLTIAQYNGTGPYNTTALKAWAVHNGNAISDFRKATEVILYDTKGNPQETRILDQDQYKAMIWDTLTGQKLAEASNCHYNDIAFTSFEATNKGNFIYETAGVEAAPVPTAGPLSGQKMYAMNSFRPTVGMTGLNPAKSYMLTFWAKDGVPSFSGPGIASLTFTAQAQRSGWIFYAAKFTPQTSGTYNIQYNGTPIYLDEIRLFPANAAMQCMTYIPLFGQGSVTDATGRITTYSYDMLGRLAVVRDQEGNIISKTQYAVHEAE